MGKFAIECPKCGSINTASTFFLAKKTIKCGACGEEFSIKNTRMTSKVCPQCGKVFVYDQTKSKIQKCPACGEVINATAATTSVFTLAKVNCPQCGCSVEADKSCETAVCPLCDCRFNVERELAKAKLVNDTGVSVIQYEGDNSTFVWKHPIEDFNLGSQLIVHESQEAIFFMNGEALDTFGPGRHTLETENIPIMKKIYKIPTGSQTPFHAEVYFINKAVQMGVRWGTDSRVRFIDPMTGIPLDIGAHGEMNLSVGDSRKLLVTLVGTEGGLRRSAVAGEKDEINSEKALSGYFKALLMTAIKSCLAQTIKEQKINILEIDEKLSELSEKLCQKIADGFSEYGLLVPQFYVTGISLPEDDKNFKEIKDIIASKYLEIKKREVAADITAAQRRVELEGKATELEKLKVDAEMQRIKAQAEADAMRAKGLSEAEIMAAKGYNQRDVLQSEVQKAYAQGIGSMGGNAGSTGGNVVSDIIGVVAGIKAAGAVGDQFGNILGKQSEPSPAPVKTEAPTGWTCLCGCKGNTGRFCMDCGKPRLELWNCSCGHKDNRGKFCENCGKPKE